MHALNVDDPPAVSVKCGFAPRAPGTAPAYLPVPGAPVESEPVAAHVDAHFPLLAEAVRGETIDAGANEAH